MKWLHIFVIMALVILSANTVAIASALDLYKDIEGASTEYIPRISIEKQEKWEIIKIVTDKGSGIATWGEITDPNIGVRRTTLGKTYSGTYSIVAQLGASAQLQTGKFMVVPFVKTENGIL